MRNRPHGRATTILLSVVAVVSAPALLGLRWAATSSRGSIRAQTEASVITLQPTVPVTVPPTAATIPLETSPTPTIEPSLPTLPPAATTTIATRPSLPYTTIGPPRVFGPSKDDPTLMPVCRSVQPVIDMSGAPTASTTSTTSTTVLRPPSASPTALDPTPCRLIAYYGNPLSTRMGVLGQYPVPDMLKRLAAQTAVWRNADPYSRTQCALELIAISAQASPGSGGLYRARMKPSVIDGVVSAARSAGCLTILDVQVGHSSVAAEVPYLLPWLALPDVHLALDPEWDMPRGVKPGTQIGTMDASDINFTVDVLSQVVAANRLGPKLLVVHRFRDFMVTNPAQIKVNPAIRLLVNMDGFGPKSTKLNSYRVAKADMPTSLTGFKLFYKNDTPIMTPADVLPLQPVPMFINYQ